jgi:hypothetical protein
VGLFENKFKLKKNPAKQEAGLAPKFYYVGNYMNIRRNQKRKRKKERKSYLCS